MPHESAAGRACCMTQQPAGHAAWLGSQQSLPHASAAGLFARLMLVRFRCSGRGRVILQARCTRCFVAPRLLFRHAERECCCCWYMTSCTAGTSAADHDLLERAQLSSAASASFLLGTPLLQAASPHWGERETDSISALDTRKHQNASMHSTERCLERQGDHFGSGAKPHKQLTESPL